jgi:hypothetical protein
MKRILLAFVLCASAASAAVADETSEVYLMIYKQAVGISQKYSAVLNIVGLGDKETAESLGYALEDLLRDQETYSSRADQEFYGRTVRLVAQALGDYKYAAAAPFLWDVAKQVPYPLARAEALISLGKIRALDYAERIALLLRDLNLKPTADRDEGEKIAYGAILALDRLKDVRGFSPVFFAAEGWYSQRVRLQAARSLPNIAPDPTDPILQIIKDESAARKARALRAESDSSAPSDRKVATAVAALAKGHTDVPTDKNESKDLADLRKLALRMLVAQKAKADEAVDGFVASYEKGFDDEERLLALAAMGASGSDAAAGALKSIILKLDEEQRSGVTSESRNRMAKAAIENAGLTKNKAVKSALVSVVSNDKWSGGIILAAQNAIKAIP